MLTDSQFIPLDSTKTLQELMNPRLMRMLPSGIHMPPESEISIRTEQIEQAVEEVKNINNKQE